MPLHARVLDLPAHRAVLPGGVAARRLGRDGHLTDGIAEATAPRLLQQVLMLLPVVVIVMVGGVASIGVAPVAVGRGPDGLDRRLLGTRVLRARAGRRPRPLSPPLAHGENDKHAEQNEEDNG